MPYVGMSGDPANVDWMATIRPYLKNARVSCFRFDGDDEVFSPL